MGRAHRRAGLGLSIAFAASSLLGAAPAAENLQQETRDLLLRLDRALAPECEERTFLEAGGPRWVLDRCGTPVAWDVRTTPTTLTAALASESPTKPAIHLLPVLLPEAEVPLPATVFVVTDLGDSGPGTLTRAILDANAARNGAAPDRIRFAIPSPGPHAIALLAPLPAITDQVVIEGDGVELDGSRLREPAPGLQILAGGSTVRGLRIRGFGAEGIRLEGGGASTLEANAIEDCGAGIAVVDSPDNRIAHNALVGSAAWAVRVVGAASTGNRILENRIVRPGKRGIELEADGESVETPGPGPNRFQPAPTLASASFVPVQEGKAVEARIEGTLAAAPGTTHHVELFATAFDVAEDGTASGDRLLAAAEVTTGPDGVAGFVFRLPQGVRSKDRITATATDSGGNTSEFSNEVNAPSLVISWNAGTGTWNTPGNWSPAQLPAAGDTVVIAANGVNTTFTVTLNVDSTISGLTVGGGSGVQTLSMASLTLTLNGASTINSGGVLTQSGGTIAGTGTLTISGTYNWTGGLQTGTGATTVNGTFNCSGIVAINGGRTLNNATTLNWNPSAGSGFRTGTGSVINNSGTWNSQTDGVIINHYGGATTFNNTGTFKKSAGTGATSVSIPFNHNGGTLEAQSGTLTMNGGGTSAAAWNASAAAAILQFGGGAWELNAGTTLAGLGKISIFTAGTVNVNAALTLPATTTLDFSVGTLGGTATFTLNGPFVWTGGLMTGAGTTTVNGTFNCSGIVAINGGRTLNNATTLNWNPATGSGFRTGTGSIINNTGTWDSQSNGVIINHYGGATTFNNSGTLKKSGGTGTTSISIPITHSGGAIEVQTGTMTLNGGGTSSAAFNASGAAGILQFGGGTWDLNAGTTLAGPGTVSIFTAGTVNVNAALTTPAATTLDFSTGTLAGTALLTLNGPFVWTGGLMTGTGTTTVNGTFNCSGIVAINGGRTLNNATTLHWNPAAGSGFRTGTGSIINNTGTWDSQSNGVIINHYGGATTFNNTGTFKKSGGTGVTSIGIPFMHTGGVIEVQVGTVTLNGGGSSSAALNVSGASGILQFGGGAWNLNAGTAIAGPGTVSIFTADTVSVNAAISTPAPTSVSFTAGTLQGTGTLTLNGQLTWTAGLMTGAGTTQVNGPFTCAGIVAINGSRILSTAGTTTWNPAAGSGIRMGTGAVISNAGTWDAPTNGVIINWYGGAANFNNGATGTFKKSAGTGVTAVNVTFTNAGTVDVQSGTLQVNSSSYTQTAGITKLTGGSLTSTTVLTFQGGVLGGSGTVTAPVNVISSGALAPGLSAGTLNLVGAYTQSSSGGYKVEIGGLTAGTQFDRVNVSGAGATATLAGTLQISLISGFVPVPGDSFIVMTYPSRTGAFTVVPPSLPCLGWNVTYGATAVTLTAVQRPPEVSALGATASKNLTWTAGAGTVTYDLLRGNLGSFPVGAGPGEVCLVNNTAATTASDPATPTAGAGFWYVVRQDVAGCGLGNYGYATSGAERVSGGCP